ncbi:Dabb family protein [Aspergillus glaucus CBS 516.65]|uniref:Stress-response A/B barrel domain-containing protein n=1 Tax=Aspergillus glaucus CBS 516.65 TaxID=1160497 RepID=A0A1L9VU73_ASPGL|nr:hypothetical protein ASPGLDRAFT_119480 [Aspergillus glaucus CBS 516.65]OJJ87452.1 hypothetical protein ASPGLDRAFT_119480 [Aspergillus glaucus CBS 516.65]
MPVFHIVLFRLKPGVSKTDVDRWCQMGKGMVGKIPGLLEFHANVPFPATAERGKGFGMGLVAILEKPEHVLSYGIHPAHQEVHRIREELCEDTLAYDLMY